MIVNILYKYIWIHNTTLSAYYLKYIASTCLTEATVLLFIVHKSIAIKYITMLKKKLKTSKCYLCNKEVGGNQILEYFDLD